MYNIPSSFDSIIINQKYKGKLVKATGLKGVATGTLFVLRDPAYQPYWRFVGTVKANGDMVLKNCLTGAWVHLPVHGCGFPFEFGTEKDKTALLLEGF